MVDQSPIHLYNILKLLTMSTLIRQYWKNGRGFVLGLAVGVSGSAAFVFQKKYLMGPPPSHKALRYGSPETSKLRYFTNFVCEVDYSSKNPIWVAEHIPCQNIESKASRKGVHYKEDENIDERFRALLSQYRGSGYDRGHMSPAANNKSDAIAMKESFYLSNCCPQVGKGFNQDYWARFERFILEMRPQCENIYVVTGPLYLPKKTSEKEEGVRPLGASWHVEYGLLESPTGNLLAIPTHFYKVILAELKNDSLGGQSRHALGAFVMPNAQIHPKTPLESFSVPVAQLEQAAGIKFFPKFFDDINRSDKTPLLEGRVRPDEEKKYLHICDVTQGCAIPKEDFWKK